MYTQPAMLTDPHRHAYHPYTQHQAYPEQNPYAYHEPKYHQPIYQGEHDPRNLYRPPASSAVPYNHPAPPQHGVNHHGARAHEEDHGFSHSEEDGEGDHDGVDVEMRNGGHHEMEGGEESHSSGSRDGKEKMVDGVFGSGSSSPKKKPRITLARGGACVACR
jgi:hypothetical protein